jgi:hypothetical protein
MKRNSLLLSVLLVLLSAGFVRAESADVALQTVAKALSENKTGPLWEALPSSYQKDMTGLVHSAIGKVDAKLYDGMIATMKKTLVVLKTQKKFVLGNAMLAGINKDGIMEKNWDTIVSFYETILESDLGSHEKAKAIDVGKFVDKTGSKMMAQTMTMMKVFAAAQPEISSGLEAFEKIKSLKATLVSETADSAVVRLEVTGEKAEEVTMVRVDGKWIPEDLADNWAGGIAQAKEAIAGISDEQMKQASAAAGPIFAMMNGVLDALANAKTQEEFDTVINGMMQLLGGGAPTQE